jgi:hypothetical protein
MLAIGCGELVALAAAATAAARIAGWRTPRDLAVEQCADERLRRRVVKIEPLSPMVTIEYRKVPPQRGCPARRSGARSDRDG